MKTQVETVGRSSEVRVEQADDQRTKELAARNCLAYLTASAFVVVNSRWKEGGVCVYGARPSQADLQLQGFHELHRQHGECTCIWPSSPVRSSSTCLPESAPRSPAPTRTRSDSPRPTRSASSRLARRPTPSPSSSRPCGPPSRCSLKKLARPCDDSTSRERWGVPGRVLFTVDDSPPYEGGVGGGFTPDRPPLPLLRKEGTSSSLAPSPLNHTPRRLCLTDGVGVPQDRLPA